MSTTSAHSPATFTFFELLDRTFRMYRENFAAYIALTAVVIIPVTIVSTVLSLLTVVPLASSPSFSRTSNSAQLIGPLCLGSFLPAILLFIEVVINNATLTYTASENYLGRKPTIAEAFRGTRQRFASLGCGLAVYSLTVVVFAVVISIIGALCSPAFAGFGFVAYVGIATYSFLVPVLVLENVGIFPGVNRAWGLGKSRFWTGLGLLLVFTVITTAISVGFTAIINLFLFRSISTSSVGAVRVISVILTNAIGIFLRPILPIGLTLFYYDTRNRQEGLDFTLQASGIPNARPADLPSPLPQAGLTSRDLINVGILVGVSLVVGLLASSAIQSLISSVTPGTRNF